ncbi:CueP family metal-binding protein [Photobacterium sp. ZSDE20]|uniref:CueP family metal-binding protein n=1 Tax=Photobacterium pectinilyticum TaxID=2906793 RepID=A0ABT1N014_9GAMM|nr:CueP family metal-binding protein [Photobacterium sp. ZSDE20]MCQ1056619.1 CueP family metal-binding protein [Photobacterium sp. ZSDE20]MDD1820754.1 CueP family metal-binding protein [Photobacterium sp. ZSDE20]
MKYLLPALLLSLSSAQALANTDAQAFSKLSPQAALKQSHQWHRTGEATVRIMPDAIYAEFADGSKATVPIEEEFLLSIAPFENVTHGCTFHVPTGCQGEMVNKAMTVEITDTQTNEVVQSGMVKTQKDGFIDFWMPKNGNYQFTFTYQGKTATEVLSTKGNSRTCITTMQLI